MINLLALIPSRVVIIGLSLIMGLGFSYLYGYHNGYQASQEKLAKATEKLLEAERSLARIASQRAADDARRLSQSRIEAQQIRRQYEDAEPHEVSPRDCVSDSQRRVLQAVADSTKWNV